MPMRKQIAAHRRLVLHPTTQLTLFAYRTVRRSTMASSTGRR